MCLELLILLRVLLSGIATTCANQKTSGHTTKSSLLGKMASALCFCGPFGRSWPRGGQLLTSVTACQRVASDQACPFKSQMWNSIEVISAHMVKQGAWICVKQKQNNRMNNEYKYPQKYLQIISNLIPHVTLVEGSWAVSDSLDASLFCPQWFEFLDASCVEMGFTPLEAWRRFLESSSEGLWTEWTESSTLCNFKGHWRQSIVQGSLLRNDPLPVPKTSGGKAAKRSFKMTYFPKTSMRETVFETQKRRSHELWNILRSWISNHNKPHLSSRFSQVPNLQDMPGLLIQRLERRRHAKPLHVVHGLSFKERAVFILRQGFWKVLPLVGWLVKDLYYSIIG